MKPSTLLALTLLACSEPRARFPLTDPMVRDDDTSPVWVACHAAPRADDPGHLSCAPKPTYDAFVWPAVDNVVFRPLSEAVSFVDESRESTNVNSLDEVPDSSWFTNRIGVRPMSVAELERGRCAPEEILDGRNAPDGSWVIDRGKMTGKTEGFRVTIPGKGHFLFKADDEAQPEHGSAAQTVGLRIYHAAGYFVPCEQIVYFRPSVFTLKPHLTYKRQFEDEKDFGQKELDLVLAHSPKRGGLVRMQASLWLPGYILGGFEYHGTRADDPNDVVPHEDRRDLRGKRLLNAWLDRTDDRLSNTVDTWMVDHPGPPDGSPGHVIHNFIDTSECFGSDYDDEDVTRRVGYTYVWDWADLSTDLLDLGARRNTWDTVRKEPEKKLFFYYNVKDFVPERWKNEYQVAAFSRMTERDGAWMARILAHFTPDVVHELARMADFTDASETAYFETVLEGRLEKILERYLTRLSPVSNVHLEGLGRVCGTDLVEWRHLRGPDSLHYSARLVGGAWLNVDHRPGGEICVPLPHLSARGPDDDPSRYVRLQIADGVAAYPLVVHLYDLGAARGFRLAGVERPDTE